MLRQLNGWALSVAATAALVPATQAAVITIDSATFSGTAGDEVITGFVAGANSSLGATLQGATVPSATGEYFFGATDPGSEAAAISGLNATTGLLNTPNNTDFFLGSLGSDDILFLLEYDFSSDGSAPFDDVRLAFIDATGVVIGDYTLQIDDIGAGGGDLLTPDLNRESGNSFQGEFLRGVTFRVSDFTGTTGDLSQIAGVTLVGGSAFDDLDLAVIGRVVPEPASAVLLTAGVMCVVTRRRSAANSQG